ncbi:NAD(P)/FAD-dependent oxidoreductase [Maribacter sp. 2210JD10-5]|uniref:NAD(P)/FAD-dependent oxidoreductase n=1 Tax=Maribacter sp. 2210JD10-5 TaxID=3386272 RepID=UPI0039BC660F
MNLSYWEYKTWLNAIDFTIVGSGIVGLNCALELRKKYPKAKILILEKGIFPQGASTKNAGFACFGSISEVLNDSEHHSEQEVINLVKDRVTGIQTLRKSVGDTVLDYRQLGGHELFLKDHDHLYQKCLENLAQVNEMLEPVFGKNTFARTSNAYGFKNVEKHYITHRHEGQIDTGKMMDALMRLVQKQNIYILNGITVVAFSEVQDGVHIKTNRFELKTKKLYIATNGFASKLIPEPVQPARAQVIITKPIPKLHVQGTFHLDQGYYYFRNIDNRILLGGGRNLDFKTEETTEFGNTKIIQNKLHELLSTVILPDIPFVIDQKWSGIMGVGAQKKPIVKTISTNVACGVRLGGMGIAVGTHVGQKLAHQFDL